MLPVTSQFRFNKYQKSTLQIDIHHIAHCPYTQFIVFCPIEMVSQQACADETALDIHERCRLELSGGSSDTDGGGFLSVHASFHPENTFLAVELQRVHAGTSTKAWKGHFSMEYVEEMSSKTGTFILPVLKWTLSVAVFQPVRIGTTFSLAIGSIMSIYHINAVF
jgi:hypothetical protein